MAKNLKDKVEKFKAAIADAATAKGASYVLNGGIPEIKDPKYSPDMFKLPNDFKVTAQLDPLSGMGRIRTPYGTTMFDPQLLAQGDCCGTTASAMNAQMQMVTDEIARKVKEQQENTIIRQLVVFVRDYTRNRICIQPDMMLLRRMVWREEPMYVKKDSGGCSCCPVCGTPYPSRFSESGREINCCSYCGQTLLWDDEYDMHNRMVVEYNECIQRVADIEC